MCTGLQYLVMFVQFTLFYYQNKNKNNPTKFFGITITNR